MIDEKFTQHNIGDMVCMCRTDKVIGTIVKYDGLFYKVHWSTNPFISNPKMVTNHLKESIVEMKLNLQQLLEEEL